MTGAWYRLIKVIYSLLLVVGLFFTVVVWQKNTPYNYTTFGHYLITCNNSATFDPSSNQLKDIVNGKPVFGVDNIFKMCIVGR
jgi:hypothetical protein